MVGKVTQVDVELLKWVLQITLAQGLTIIFGCRPHIRL